MDLAVKVLGSTAVAHLSKLTTDHVLVIGRDKLTRSDLGDVGCYNFVAARYLSAACQALQVSSLKELFDTIPPTDLALPHVGVISLAVLGAAFEAKGVGGDSPLENYVRKHSAKLRTFSTIKHQMAEQQNATRAKRRRTRR
jgi:hypothetical protein